MTPLDKTLKRSIKIGAVDFVVTLTPTALKVTQKGRRRGFELAWVSLISGDSALAVALQASVGKFEVPTLAPKRAAPAKQAIKKAASRRRGRR